MTFSIKSLSVHKQIGGYTYSSTTGELEYSFFCESCYGTPGSKRYTEQTSTTLNAPYKVYLKSSNGGSDLLNSVILFLCSEHYDKAILIFFSELDIRLGTIHDNDSFESYTITLGQDPNLNRCPAPLLDAVNAFLTEYNSTFSENFPTSSFATIRNIRSFLHNFINDFDMNFLNASNMDMLD